MAKIVILGAGLTGLSTAYHLEQNGFFDYEIYEKENEFGGLCRSIYQDGFTFDYTGHLLHINDKYLESLVDKLIGKENFNSIHRKSFIYSNDIYTHYPFQINLYGLPNEVIVECIEGFLTKKLKKNPKSFYDWSQSNFGSGFAKHFFQPFQNKIFDYDIKKVTASWTGRFVPQTSLEQIIKGAISAPEPSNIGYNCQFFYPRKGGIYYWIKKLAENIQNKVQTNFEAKSIDLKNKTILFKNGHTANYSIMINTIPLDTFLDFASEKTNSSFKSARKNLVSNSVVNFNLGIKRENLSDKHWIYFPENQYPFYRLGFGSNFASNMAPKKHSSIYGEFSYIGKTQEQIDQLLKDSIKKTKELLNIADTEIVTQKNIHIKHAYVIYNFWREKNLPTLLNELQKDNIYSIGRYGAWKYSSMQEAVLDGKEVAKQILCKI